MKTPFKFTLLAAMISTLVACGQEADVSNQVDAAETSVASAVPEVKSAPQEVEASNTAETIAEKVEAVVTPEQVTEAQKEVEKQVDDVQQTVAAKVEAVQDVKALAAGGKQTYATCVGCHGAQGEGGIGPKLAGQSVDALVEKMKGYRSGQQFGPMTGMMAPMVAGLSDEKIASVAHYIDQNF